ncbi:matrixin family metalloprotease [Lacticaseibacillus zeae]|uniref:Matrixin family metalloprotease n=1 Tax=Lacticaseibacillus zeae TaxID=57037 RepID=A0A5R8LJI0_LACZE|nr:matrixin family metalloprotease [Lacticaseibacillus zeae]TLF37390.1 matrixin family metalloprotease [Lacticaseibacillus zeae]
MKHRNRLFWVIVLVAGIFLIYSTESPLPIATHETVKNGIAQVWNTATRTVSGWLNDNNQANQASQASSGSLIASNTSQSATSTSTSADTTPALNIVQGRHLRKTYYYHFDANLPQSEHNVFNEAVRAYNATGIVKLIPGKGQKNDNQITFSSYQKGMSEQDLGATELGEGGPTIIVETMGTQVTVINHARASLNLTYPAQSINEAVAMHELGHALGLDHSKSLDSVMYPITRGVTQLSSGDIAGLKAIYGQ